MDRALANAQAHASATLGADKHVRARIESAEADAKRQAQKALKLSAENGRLQGQLEVRLAAVCRQLGCDSLLSPLTVLLRLPPFAPPPHLIFKNPPF